MGIEIKVKVKIRHAYSKLKSLGLTWLLDIHPTLITNYIPSHS
jgi:hypothetical protein